VLHDEHSKIDVEILERVRLFYRVEDLKFVLVLRVFTEVHSTVYAAGLLSVAVTITIDESPAVVWGQPEATM